MVPVDAVMVPTEDGQSYSIRLAGNKRKKTTNTNKNNSEKRHKALFLFYRKVNEELKMHGTVYSARIFIRGVRGLPLPLSIAVHVYCMCLFNDPCQPLFHYKVYHMASLRLRDLCMRLDVGNDLLEKV